MAEYRLTPEQRRSLIQGIPIDIEALERYLDAAPENREFALELLREPSLLSEPSPDGREHVVNIAPGPRTLRTTNAAKQALWEAIFARDNR